MSRLVQELGRADCSLCLWLSQAEDDSDRDLYILICLFIQSLSSYFVCLRGIKKTTAPSLSFGSSLSKRSGWNLNMLQPVPKKIAHGP